MESIKSTIYCFNIFLKLNMFEFKDFNHFFQVQEETLKNCLIMILNGEIVHYSFLSKLINLLFYKKKKKFKPLQMHSWFDTTEFFVFFILNRLISVFFWVSKI